MLWKIWVAKEKLKEKANTRNKTGDNRILSLTGLGTLTLFGGSGRWPSLIMTAFSQRQLKNTLPPEDRLFPKPGGGGGCGAAEKLEMPTLVTGSAVVTLQVTLASLGS